MNISDPAFQLSGALELPVNEVHLWRLDLASLSSAEERWRIPLSADEKDRASRFVPEHSRQNFVVTRALLRILLAAYLQTDAAQIAFLLSANGKPRLGPPHATSGIAFNISHSGRVALLAFNRGRELGVDIEQIRHDLDPAAIARRYFSSHEQAQLAAIPAEEKYAAFFRCWTRKEAYIKARGDGLSLPLAQFDVSFARGDANALVATRPDNSEARRWFLREVPAGPGYVAALCVAGDDWVLRDWANAAAG